MKNKEKLAVLFEGWEETLIWSCLQGYMGYAVTDKDEDPTGAMIVVADFCFFGGTPQEELAAKAAAPILVPQNKAWEEMLEKVWGNRLEKALRYSIQKEEGVFDTDNLEAYVQSLPNEFELKMIDKEAYEKTLKENWSSDLCSQFADYDDFNRRGIGFVVCKDGNPVAGASSYTVYREGIEIEIDTALEYRRRGLATVCGAALILECLKRGLYPSWDAYDLRSVSLAEKLGYHRGDPYSVYYLTKEIE